MEYEEYKNFMKNMRSRMKELEITQIELSMMTGISQANISKYLLGVMIPSELYLHKITRALQCDVEYLLRPTYPENDNCLWLIIPDHPHYDLNDRGEVRNRKNGRILKQHKNAHGELVVQLDRVLVNVDELMIELFS